MSRIVEISRIKETLTRVLPDAGRFPLQPFRLGYVEEEKEHTPRRPLESVLKPVILRGVRPGNWMYLESSVLSRGDAGLQLFEPVQDNVDLLRRAGIGRRRGGEERNDKLLAVRANIEVGMREGAIYADRRSEPPDKFPAIW
jgi:hypothetical protein